MKSKIAIADDHPLISAATRTIIENFEDYSVLFEAENGNIFIERLTASNIVPDIALLDMSMPVMDGLETTLWLSKNYPQIKIIINTIQIDVDSFLRLFELGVWGFVTKNARPHILLDTLKCVHQNKPSYPAWAMDVLNKHYPFSKLSKDQFTPDDLICLNELCTYQSPELIALKLNKSVAEVLEIEQRFFEKFNVHTKNALIYFSQQSQLIG